MGDSTFLLPTTKDKIYLPWEMPLGIEAVYEPGC